MYTLYNNKLTRSDALHSQSMQSYFLKLINIVLFREIQYINFFQIHNTVKRTKY